MLEWFDYWLRIEYGSFLPWKHEIDFEQSISVIFLEGPENPKMSPTHTGTHTHTRWILLVLVLEGVIVVAETISKAGIKLGIGLHIHVT